MSDKPKMADVLGSNVRCYEGTRKGWAVRSEKFLVIGWDSELNEERAEAMTRAILEYDEMRELLQWAVKSGTDEDWFNRAIKVLIGQ